MSCGCGNAEPCTRCRWWAALPPEEQAAEIRRMDEHVARQIDRDSLRRIARDLGVPTGYPTKRDLAIALAFAGVKP